MLKFNFDIEDLEFKEEILAHSVLQVTLELKGVYANNVDIGYTRFGFATVKPLITNTSKEFIKCRILHFLIMECCRYLVF